MIGPKAALLVRIPANLKHRAKLAALRRRIPLGKLVAEALVMYLRKGGTP